MPAGTVLFLATARSKDVASRLAARRGLSVVQDVVSIDGSNLTSPIYSGKANQTVTVNGDTVVSVRANVFSGVGSGSSNDVSVVDASGDVKTAVQDVMERASTRLDVSEANIISSGGRGMGSPANFSHLEAVADTIGAAVGASRAAVDTWEEIPHSMQVGQTGKTVNPNLYIAVGISGHPTSCWHAFSKYIVAINKDADAPIFQHADYGIVATWEEALPVFQDALQICLVKRTFRTCKRRIHRHHRLRMGWWLLMSNGCEWSMSRMDDGFGFSGHNFVRMLFDKTLKSPPVFSKSVRPTDPANNVSPTNK